MNYAQTDAASTNPDVAINTPMAHVLTVSGEGQRPPELTPRVAYPQAAIPLNEQGQCLRLWDAPMLVLDLIHGGCEVEDWGVSVDLADVTAVPREMAREFLRLWVKAEKGVLNAEERNRWGRIVEKVDYQHFCMDRAPARYVEGELQERAHDHAIVRWHDGSTEHVRGAAYRSLALVDRGEIFSAMVRFDRNERVSSLMDVVPLGRPEAIHQEFDWLRTV
jgi:hypothetical protein